MEAKIIIDTQLVRNTISHNLFGHFMEHSGDVIYDGIFDPGNPLSDKDGFREDVCQAIMASGASTLRYPGGNFVSNYHWMDGIGPRESRPKVFDYAWLTDDDNRMGTVEFIQLCRKCNAQPYICVNMGSGTAEEAMHWVEFCNGTGDGEYANLRRKLGYEEPFGVKYWGLGNEMYGDWQFGACDAETYAKKAKDFAKAMKWVDPSIELVAAGYDLDSDWNRIVAKVCKQLISHIAIHHYSIGYGIFKENDYKQCMYIPDYLDKLTKACHASIISGTNDALTEIKVAWDEWNTYAWNLEGSDNDEIYNLSNAILTALILHSFIRSSNVVEIASYSPFVNKCGALRTRENGLLKRTQFYVFEMLKNAFSECDRYVEIKTCSDTYAMREVIDYSNRLPEPAFALNVEAAYRTVHTPYVDAVAATNAAKDRLVLSLVNKHEDEDCTVDLTVFGAQIDWESAKIVTLYDEDIHAANTFDAPDRVLPKEDPDLIKDGTLLLRKHSLTVVTFACSIMDI